MWLAAGLYSGSVKSIRVPRYDDNDSLLALLIHSARLPGQSRGEPYLAPVVDRFKQLERYTDAEIRASVLNAFYAAFITTETPTDIDQRRMTALPESRLDLSPEVLTQHFQSSYSAARGAILEAWKAYRTRRSWLVAEFCQPVLGVAYHGSGSARPHFNTWF